MIRVIIVSNATMPHQTVLDTTLGAVDAFLETNTPATPAIVVVGRISEWRAILDWYDSRAEGESHWLKPS